MQVCEGLSGSFVVLDEPSEARGPCKGSLDDPSSWEQNEAAFCLRQFNHLDRDAVFCGSRSSSAAGVTLVDESDLDALPRRALNVSGDPAHFGAIVGVGGRHMQRQKMIKCIDGQMQLRSFLAFGAVVGASGTALAASSAAFGCQ